MSHLADIAVAMVILVSAHGAGAGYVQSAEGKTPMRRPVFASIFSMALFSILLSWHW